MRAAASCSLEKAAMMHRNQWLSLSEVVVVVVVSCKEVATCVTEKMGQRVSHDGLRAASGFKLGGKANRTNSLKY